MSKGFYPHDFDPAMTITGFKKVQAISNVEERESENAMVDTRLTYDFQTLRLLVDAFSSDVDAKTPDNRFTTTASRFELHMEVKSPDLPMAYRFDGSRIYVRECYPVYYELLLACLRSGFYDFLTVTGTPGTGKSMFYMYVFERYRAEHSGERIITASFRKDRTLKKCLVYEPGQLKPVEFGAIPFQVHGLHLYDGPPSGEPADDKMICFTSPNTVWLNMHERNTGHKPIYFPAWTLSELVEANSVCGLGIRREVILNRFMFFGGSARYCLSLFEDDVVFGKEKIHERVSSMKSNLDQFLTDMSDDEIVNCVPIMTTNRPFVGNRHLQVCSKEVLKMIFEELLDADANNGGLFKIPEP